MVVSERTLALLSGRNAHRSFVGGNASPHSMAFKADMAMMIEQGRPSGWYDPPEGLAHCDCPPCEIGKCTGKVQSSFCNHGENDIPCDHYICVIDNCGELLKKDDEDFCEQHQLVYEMVGAEVGR